MPKELDPPDDYVDVEILPVRYGRICCTCQRLLHISKFEHKITPARAKALGYKAEHAVKQDWKECRECTRDRGVLPKPPSKLTRAQIIRETDKGRLPERHLKENIQAAETRALNAQRFAVGERHSRAWGRPFVHAIEKVTAEMHRVRMLRKYNDRPATLAVEVVAFCDAYMPTLEALRAQLYLAKRSERGRRDRARAQYLSARKSEHYQTNTRTARPRGRPPSRPQEQPCMANVCMPQSVWADYMPEGEVARLRELWMDVPLRLRAKRMRVVPLLIDVEQARVLQGYEDLEDDVRARLGQLSAPTVG